MAPAGFILPPVRVTLSENEGKKNDEGNRPVEASTMRRMTVITPNKKIAPAKTERVGHLLINGAIRMAPTH